MEMEPERRWRRALVLRASPAVGLALGPVVAWAAPARACRHAFVSASCFASESWLALPGTLVGLALVAVAMWAWRRRAPSGRARVLAALTLVALAHATMLVAFHQPALRPAEGAPLRFTDYVYPSLVVLAVVAHALMVLRLWWARGAGRREGGRP
jgi:hypothetical protein